ncbi:MAG: sulfurtransferase [Anaerolineae bacterium]|nr:sulfurtransferase [Anaerolineae bacterium]
MQHKRNHYFFSFMLAAFFFIFLGAGSVMAHFHLPTTVSADWLEANSSLNNLVILDIRSSAEYEAGHIPGSINEPFEVPFSAWITMRDDLLLELPDKADLFSAIGALGITKQSVVVVVTQGTAVPPFPLANATRVADTLIYAGVRHVTILDGGYAKWVEDGKAETQDVPTITPVSFRGSVNHRMFVTIDYVVRQINKPRGAILVDARDADVYNGLVIEPWADKPGHIPTARSLPAPLLWNEDGTYKSHDELKALAEAVVGTNRNKEIIVYCGVGGYSSSWWYVLTQELGYTNVKIYDGASQEWVRYYDMVLD